jgi:Peptidase inhibitor I78 family
MRNTVVLGLSVTVMLGACTSSIGPGGTGGVSDDCAAATYEPLVGQNVAVLNDAELPEDVRVNFPGAAISEDSNPGRLNINVGTDDTITRVYCG